MPLEDFFPDLEGFHHAAIHEPPRLIERGLSGTLVRA
jgi:hypothetical protein